MNSDKDHQAIDAFGLPNEACSAQKSLPLDLRPDAVLRDLDADHDPDSDVEKISPAPASKKRLSQHNRRGPFFAG